MTMDLYRGISLRADDLVANDNNDVEDIFIYSVYDDSLIRLTNPLTGEEEMVQVTIQILMRMARLSHLNLGHPIFQQEPHFIMAADRFIYGIAMSILQIVSD